MGKQFEGVNEVEVDTTPEQVWQAIASGPGFDSWFMGRNEVQPGGEGSWRMSCFGDFQPTHRVTAWEDGKHLTYRSDTADDGRFMAYEFLIEGRDSGTTVLRMVTSGFLPGDDWADEYEAMTLGGQLFAVTLATYLTHFAGRTATPVTVFGPPVRDWPEAWRRLRTELGLTGQPSPGTSLRYAAPETGPIDGTVYFANAQTIGIRTADAMYRFVQGMPGCMVAMHHEFAGAGQTEQGWQSWLTRVFG